MIISIEVRLMKKLLLILGALFTGAISLMALVPNSVNATLTTN
jgi:hypothetical protein